MEDVLVQRQGAVQVLSFNRAHKKNAITAAMYAQLAEGILAAEADPTLRVILIQGHPEAFSAGNDLEDFLKHPPTDGDAPVFRFLYAISEATKPIVAAVSGNAVGVGTTMLLHCDVVYAAETARFSLPFSQLALCPEAASSWLLPRVAGYQRAAEKLLFGEPFDVNEAVAMGFVNRVVPVAELSEYAARRAAQLAAMPAGSLRVTKQLMKGDSARNVRERIGEEALEFGKRLVSPEAREAFTAFFEKRKPDFTQFS
ncbi:enoyl-CoA hydratase [Pandoraea pnomenusa]|uniref:Probable enoyl-CoA hydratase echA8 n=1 Tax=Pandoraea pnomenusa TaxID=93220 RepID=A0A378YST8_9BURK|nr:enoyl-CoA hydratase [Pandoraea pnomenusa]AHN75148.1 enoyl-CoA hydratase [Pandoraea pnomenusa]AIU28267.1 enoyl-CoA hydratase [Pandoraea pnomenusa]ANC45386.1 enoyl-CoA hydratase [Pandoraea pnomenusa]MBN9092202.1 enoyl-CoA hydratase [Pandoraea pnomenusa]QDH58520.1 enoyl-CoA hydratase [Pandoraea pnomenusa]